MRARDFLGAPTGPAAADGPSPRDVWRRRLHDALRGRPTPFLWTEQSLVPAATLWAGARRWTAAWRALGLGPGDRVLLALQPGPGFVMALVAALWDGLTVAPLPAPRDAADLAVAAACDALDARLAVVPAGSAWYDGAMAADAAGIPDESRAVRARDAALPPTPDARCLLRTSGSTGAPRWLASSDANLLAVLDAHAAPLAYAGGTALSVLPWHHAFGLVLELLAALLGGADLLRDPSGGRDPSALAALAREHPVTHLSAVPHTVRLLAEHDAGSALLDALAHGVVGGAPVDAALAERLSRTRLRVGYGQTEAAPGVLLGEPGAWRAATLGRPLAHPLAPAVRRTADGALAFRGPNACVGEWRPGLGLVALDPARWVDTGDLAREEPDGTWTYEGRTAHAFKLANGRFVGAGAIEDAVRALLPGLSDVVLSSPDGERLVIAASAPDDGARARLDAAVREPLRLAPALGPLAGRPLRVVAVAPDAWVRTPKGEVDRRHPTGRPAIA